MPRSLYQVRLMAVLDNGARPDSFFALQFTQPVRTMAPALFVWPNKTSSTICLQSRTVASLSGTFCYNQHISFCQTLRFLSLKHFKIGPLLAPAVDIRPAHQFDMMNARRPIVYLQDHIQIRDMLMAQWPTARLAISKHGFGAGTK